MLHTSCPTVSGLITGVNEGKEPELRLSDAISLGSAALLGLSVTGSQAQKPTSAVGSVTDTAQLTAAAHTHKNMSICMHARVHTHTHTHTLLIPESNLIPVPTQVITFSTLLIFNNAYSSAIDTVC